MKASKAALNIRISPELRARVAGCAKLEGISVPEYARAALVAHCTATERRSAMRDRAARKAAAEGGA